MTRECGGAGSKHIHVRKIEATELPRGCRKVASALNGIVGIEFDEFLFVRRCNDVSGYMDFNGFA